MYKSSIGIFFSNLLIIWIVLLNNEGPGWEVPSQTMDKLAYASFFLIICTVFSFVMLIISLKQLKIRKLLFKIAYSLNLFICIAAVVFLFLVNGFHGQFWFESFPKETFTLIAVGINVMLFVSISIGRFKNDNSKK